MESNISDQQYFGTDLQLTEPHFDEEATLLSARPVVPLGDVRPETRSGRRLAFGLAMVVAVMAGAIGASLIYKQRSQIPATAIVDTGTPVPEPAVPEGQLLSGAGGARSDSSPSPVPEKVDVATPVVRKGGANTEIRKSVPTFSGMSGRARDPLQDEASNDSDERELRRAERMEARRLRREAKREARGRSRQSSDDLLRIREIFEGSRRP